MARNPADDMRDYVDEIVDKGAAKGNTDENGDDD